MRLFYSEHDRLLGQLLVCPEIGNIGTGPDTKINFGGYVVYQALA